MGANFLALVGERVVGVPAQGKVIGMGDVKAIDVSVACETEVSYVDLVRLEDAVRIRPDQEVVLVK